MHDVIEHVKDPVGLVGRVRELLPSGGLFVIATPDAGSLWARVWANAGTLFVPPQHLFILRKNLTMLLEIEGFEIIHSDHRGKWFTIPYIFRLLFSWTGYGFFRVWPSGHRGRFSKIASSRSMCAIRCF